jgi:Gas vesicle protein K/Gas vesicle protein
LSRTSSIQKQRHIPLVGKNKPQNQDQLQQNGLAGLVLTLADLLRQVLERQAIRRLDRNELSSEEIEQLGIAFIELKKRIEELTKIFGITKEALNLNLESLLKTGNRTLDNNSLADVLDTCIQKGLVLAGKVRLSVADVDLVGLDLYAALHPITGKSTKG